MIADQPSYRFTPQNKFYVEKKLEKKTFYFHGIKTNGTDVFYLHQTCILIISGPNLS